MKRARFVGTASALLLAGCGGGHHLSSPVPGVANSSTTNPKPQSLQLVPTTADQIPASVLATPIIGEGRRFDGAVAPAAWMLAQGQTLNVADYGQLFSILGTSAGGDGKATFKLPNPGFGFIVASAGLYPSSPTSLARSGRQTLSQQASLGPNAIAVNRPPKIDAARQQAVAASRNLSSSSLPFARANPSAVSSALQSRIDSTHVATRDTALSVLSSSNRANLESAMERVARGQGSLNDAVVQMTPLLSASESSALLQAHDARQGQFRDRWTGSSHANPQLEAARFVVSMGFSNDQMQRFLALQP